MDALAAKLKAQARRLGFDPVGIAPAASADDFAHFRDWLADGHAGEMSYLHRHADARQHPASILSQVRSVVMVGMSHNSMGNGEWGMGNEDPSSHSPFPIPHSPLGRVARYAQGPDYHDVLRTRLKELLAWLRAQRPDCWGRAVVDTAPLLERDFARRAGLGWIGKNTMLIDKRRGSYLFLGALLVDIDLTPDEPFHRFHCGTCTACLDACPTGAFVGPHRLDARRCISYLTIELRGEVPEELRPAVDDWIFGCDVCQEVCPWNRKALAGTFPHRDDLEALDPIELLAMSEDEYRRRFTGTALTRTGRTGLRRNAALVLGNRGDASALPALRRALDDVDAVVCEAARWAIAQIERRAGSVSDRSSVNSGR